MRFSPLQLPDILVLILPLAASLLSLSAPTVLAATLTLLCARQFIRVRDYYRRRTRDAGLVILDSLPFSHYVEKVRWCLDHLGVQYAEEQDVGIVGVLIAQRGVPRLRIPARNISIYNSSDILRYLHGARLSLPSSSSGQEVGEDFLRPTRRALELEAKIDKFGIDVRKYFYYHALVGSPLGGDACALKLWGYQSPNIPQWQKWLLKATIFAVRPYLLWILDCDSAEKASAALEDSRGFWRDADELVKEAEGGKYILGTDEPTFVDFSLAGVSSLMLMPSAEEGGTVAMDEASRPKPEDTSPECQEEISRMRSTPAGRFVMKLYRENRYRQGRRHGASSQFV